MSVFLAPLVKAFLRIPKGLAGSPPVYMRFTLAVYTPAEFKSEKVEIGFTQRRFGTERNYLRLVCGQLQSKLAQSFS